MCIYSKSVTTYRDDKSDIMSFNLKGNVSLTHRMYWFWQEGTYDSSRDSE